MAVVFKEIMPLELLRGDIIILVMGPPRSGKSNFIQQLLTGHPEPQDLQSGAKEIKAFRILSPRLEATVSSLVVVDMPGFDCTQKDNYDTFNMISTWLRQSYSDGFPVAGLVYCHRISDSRITGQSNFNLRMLAKITGADTLEKVTLLQTEWEAVRPDTGQTRDKELRDKFWGPLVEGGATVEQFRNSHEEAWAVVRRFVNVHTRADPLLLQNEMVNAKRRMGETTAGKELYREYQRVVEKQRERLLGFRSQQITPETRARVEQEIQEQDEKLNRSLQDLRKLEITLLRKLILRMFRGGSKSTKEIDIPAAPVGPGEWNLYT